MLTFLVIVSHTSCRTCRSLRPYLPFPFWVSPSLIPKKCALSFHALTNCPFCNPFPFRFMHAMGGVPPASQRLDPLLPDSSSLIPFVFRSLRTLLRFFAPSKYSTPLFSIVSTLCVKNTTTGGRVVGPLC